MQTALPHWSWLHPSSGSYEEHDVQFLLANTHCASLDVAEKEAAIQRGALHYSECVTKEDLPAPDYLHFYHQALHRHIERLAHECIRLAQGVIKHFQEHVQTNKIVWISLARAGTPIGILLHRWAKHQGLQSYHYSVSVLKGEGNDKGLDLFAFNEIVRRHSDALECLLWVDGWVGKGSITQRLKQSMTYWNALNTMQLNPPLAVIADPTGCADFFATQEDYLVPHALLNATISGCISRTTVPIQAGVAPHGTAFFEHLLVDDQSKSYIDTLWNTMLRLPTLKPEAGVCRIYFQPNTSKNKVAAALAIIHTKSAVNGADSIKVGIPETTRVFLRRLPAALWLNDIHHPDVAHLKYLATQKNVPIIAHAELPYRAVGIIKE
ncbi:MAG: cysteine protease StiP domain-containing protein [Pseudomonadota bacterium]